MKVFLIFFISFSLLIPVFIAGLVFGQPVSELIPAKTRELTIPFEVRPDRSADPVREVELLYSQDRGVHWHSSDRKPLEAGKFGFQAEKDGEYWFAFRTITLSGVTKQSTSAAPLRVLVDATPPKLSVEMKQLDSGELFVNWKAEDQHIQVKRPDFAVSVPASGSTDSAKNWRSLNIDGQNVRVLGSSDSLNSLNNGLEGSFRFFPENGVSRIELRASISDRTGNRVEKTISATIRPVHRDVPATAPIVSATHANSVNAVPLRTNLTPEPVTPPKPVRIRQPTKTQTKTKTKNENENENNNKNPLLPQSETTKKPITEAVQKIEEHEAVKTERLVPILVSPEGKVAGISEKLPEDQPINQINQKNQTGSDQMAEELLANMGAFFEGGLSVEVVKAVPAVTAPAMPTDKLTAQQPAAQQPEAKPETKLLVAGSITGISLNTTSNRPQIIVKWHIGDAPWRDAQIDVLRGAVAQGPWQPIAINLQNNGEYWWFLTPADLKPFFIMVRIRSVHNGVSSDVTESPIEINPALLKRSK
ncbi:MAG: hypothetical protein LBQ50_03140 [Planctomycetaceae bacterium]|jgi:hypothetical protein|nr:hypothetical protein [Planctomycetaceae bacterium]